MSLLLLLACSGGVLKGGCDPSALSRGDATATVDGEDWSGDAGWILAGSSIQFNLESDGAFRMTIVAQTLADGTSASDAVEAGAFPVEVDLVTGGFVTLYAEGSSTSYTTRNGSGTLTIQSADGSDRLGCASFEAVSDDGAAVPVDGLLFDAQQATFD